MNTDPRKLVSEMLDSEQEAELFSRERELQEAMNEIAFILNDGIASPQEQGFSGTLGDYMQLADHFWKQIDKANQVLGRVR